MTTSFFTESETQSRYAARITLRLSVYRAMARGYDSDASRFFIFSRCFWMSPPEGHHDFRVVPLRGLSTPFPSSSTRGHAVA